MLGDTLKNKAHNLVQIAYAQGLIIKYEDWCGTSESNKYALDDTEIESYFKYKNKEVNEDDR